MKQILILMPEAFLHGWGGATPRLFDIASTLDEHGWAVSLMMREFSRNREGRSAVDAFPGFVLLPPHRLYPSAFDFRGIRMAYRYLLKMRGLDVCEHWGCLAKNWYLKRTKSRPSVIWGTTTGNLWDLLWARDLAKDCNARLILEFHDPISIPSSTHQPIFESCLRAADLIVTTTQSYADHLVRAMPFLRGKTRAMYLTYDDRKTPGPANRNTNESLTFLHAGTLYGGVGRTVVPLVRALARCACHDTQIEQGCRLILLGTGPGVAEACRVAAQLGVEQMVEARAQVTPDECLRQMDESDVLLVVKFAQAAFDMQIPGKLFHCMGRGKPILGLMRETEASEILLRSGLGTVVAPEDEETQTRLVLDYWANRHRLTEAYRPDWDYIRRFSRSEFRAAVCQEVDALHR